MPAPKETLYDVLGVPRNAKLTDIGRAYNRLKSELQKESAAPDPHRDARVREAYEVLSDLDRRDAYDATLVVQRRAMGAKQVGSIAGLVLLLGAGAYLYSQRSTAPAPKPGRAQHEIHAEAARSVGRVKSIDISGGSAAAGIAFTIEEGVMVTTCQGLSAGAQLVVNIASRSIPARMTDADTELGLCKLAVDGAGSWPLALSNAEPRAGEWVFTANVSAAGDVVLTESKVQRVMAEPTGRVIEVSTPLAPEGQGGPLLDTNGRVVGVATLSPSDGKARHRPMPAAWITQARAPSGAPEPASPAPAAAAAAAPSADAALQLRVPGSGAKTTEERREELHKAFRPPPNVPAEIDNAK